MGLAAAVVGLRLLSLCSGPGSLWRGAWLPFPEGVIDASARGALLAFLLSGTVRSCNMPQRQMICRWAIFRMPAVLRRPRPSGAFQGVLRTRVVPCFFDDTVLTQSPNSQGITLPPSVAAADSHGEAHGSAMFELRERDELP